MCATISSRALGADLHGRHAESAKRKRSTFEELDPRRLLAAFAFTEQTVFEELGDIVDVEAADVDGDGHLDIVTSLNGGAAWFPNVDGTGVFGAARLIPNPNANVALSVATGDLDGDGDVDLVVGSDSGESITWYENTDGQGTFGKPTSLVAPDTVFAVYSVKVADVDGDGDLDVLAGSSFSNGVLWFENQDAAGGFSTGKIAAPEEVRGPEAIDVVDFDGDGDLDIVGAAYLTDTVFWIENVGGESVFGSAQIINTPAGFAFSVDASDLDGDGDQDLLVAAASFFGGTLTWHENIDGQLSEARILDGELANPRQVLSVDLDGDGDQDVLLTSGIDNNVTWYENTDGMGTLGPPTVIADAVPTADGLDARDIDGDGDIDVVVNGSATGEMFLAFNQGAAETFDVVSVTPGTVANIDFTLAADMDQDGDIDIVAVGRNSIAWFENEDGRGSFSQKHAIAADVGAIADLPGAAVADMDQDGDLDVLIAKRSGASIIWYENNGQGRFENRHESPDMDTGPWRIVANDMDGDGDVDVVTSSYFDRRTTWFENIDGVGTLHERDISFPELGSFSPVAVADIDGDGDPDVITGEAGVVIGGSGKLSWFDNYDGKGSFDEAWILQTGVDFFGAVAAGDLDGDGDQDVIAAISGSIDFISWFENTDGLGTFSSENRLADLGFSLFFGTVWLEPVDVDQDGDLDVVVSNSLDRTIQWYENLDGAGNFGPDPHIISSEFPGASGLAAVDIDGDGDRDIVTPSTRGISWFRNDTRFDYNRDGAIDADDIDLLCGSLLAIEQDSRFDANDEGVVDRQDLSVLVHEVLGTDLGDANLDGSVDQLDLVQILQAGQYHDAIEDNSGWSAGDFNCDGDADQHDIIAVLKSGGFANAALAASTRLASHLKGATIRGQNWQLDATPENSQVQPDVVEIVDQLFAEDAGMARTHVKSQTRTFTEDDEFLSNVI